MHRARIKQLERKIQPERVSAVVCEHSEDYVKAHIGRGSCFEVITGTKAQVYEQLGDIPVMTISKEEPEDA